MDRNEKNSSGAPSLRESPPLRTNQPPAPRLQLRWEGGEEKGRFTTFSGKELIDREWRCHYELVLPLREFDIRREVYEDGEQVGDQSELVVALTGCTKRGATREPCRNDDGALYADEPYRDGAHARWDAAILGDLPVYVIALDGTALLSARKDGAPQKAEGDSHGR